MKKLVLLILAPFVFSACGNNTENTDSQNNPPKSELQEVIVDDGKGIGEIKHVKLNNPLDADMLAAGKGIYELKCAACHKLTAQRVVGPGWAGITERRTPEWIMNMTLNVEEMLEKDKEAREMLKECLVRMPNQNLSKEDARSVLEYMYDNDQAK